MPHKVTHFENSTSFQTSPTARFKKRTGLKPPTASFTAKPICKTCGKKVCTGGCSNVCKCKTPNI